MLANALGTTATSIEQWEQGLAIPSLSLQEALCRLFDMQPQDLGLSPMVNKQEQSMGISFLLKPYSTTVLSLPGEDDENLSVGIYDPALPLPSIYADELIGRDDLLRQCRQQLLAHHCLGLYGSPGIGKTA